jgi:hypothetical protein
MIRGAYSVHSFLFQPRLHWFVQETEVRSLSQNNYIRIESCTVNFMQYYPNVSLLYSIPPNDFWKLKTGEPLFTLRPPFGKFNAGVRGRAYCRAGITYTATLCHVSQDVQVQIYRRHENHLKLRQMIIRERILSESADLSPLINCSCRSRSCGCSRGGLGGSRRSGGRSNGRGGTWSRSGARGPS